MRSVERIGIMNVPANLDRKQCIDFIINTKLSKYNRNALNQMHLKNIIHQPYNVDSFCETERLTFCC